MAKIPFGIKYRPQIESGEYKAILECGIEAEILAWDQPGEYPIICVAKIDDAIPFRADGNGKAYHLPEGANYSDLFLVTTKEEPSKFEKAVGCTITDAQLIPRDKDGIANIHDIDEFIRKKAAELLALAFREFKENEATHMKEFVDHKLKEAYEKGKADALKDLPRWSKNAFTRGCAAIDISGLTEADYIRREGKLLSISNLEKLPGFKED